MRTLRALSIAAALLAPTAACRDSTAKKSESKAVTTTNDLDVGEVRKWFGDPHVNTGVPEDQAVRVCDEFAKAASPGELGDGVWFGALYEVSQDGTSGDGFLFMRVKHEGGGAVAYVAGLVPESGSEEAEARTVLAALKKGQPPPAGETLKYVKTAPTEHAWAPLNAVGKSRVVAERPPRFLRQSGNRLLLIQALPKYANDDGTPKKGTGRFAELWKLP
jgi:hypothetical protein